MEFTQYSRVRYGRRRRHRKSRPTWPTSCSHDRKLICLRQWMKQQAGFDISLSPAVFAGSVIMLVFLNKNTHHQGKCERFLFAS